MAVAVNKNTAQTPLASGRTGAQAIKWVDCPRIYIKAIDSSPTPVVLKSNGVTPSGWTDLGIVNGAAKIAYEKEIQEVRTGIDNVLRQQYVKQRTGSFEFTLSQVDDVVLEQMTGVTPSIITAGSIVQFNLGGEDIITKAILIVSTNKLDSKEMQFYHPGADIVFNIENSGEEMVVRATAKFKSFTWAASASGEALFIPTVFA